MDEEPQSFLGFLDSEVSLDLSQFNGESVDGIQSESSNTLLKNEVTNDGVGNDGNTNTSPSLFSNWLKGCSSFGNQSVQSSCNNVADEIVLKYFDDDISVAELGLPSLDSWSNNTLRKVPESRSTTTDNRNFRKETSGVVPDDDNDFDIAKESDRFSDGKICAQNPRKRKFTADLTTDDKMDDILKFLEDTHNNVFDTNIEQRSMPHPTPQFEQPKTKQHDVTMDKERFSNSQRRETRNSRKNSTPSDRVKSAFSGFATASLDVSIGLSTPSASVEDRRATRSKRHRSASSQSTSDDFSPVPSPAFAEVPSLNSVDTTKYIDDELLTSLDTKELNKRVKTFSKIVIDQIKHRRRTLKNRGYARSCREKKMSETTTLQQGNSDLIKELASKKLELEVAILQRDEWKGKFKQLAVSFINLKRGLNCGK